jgi:predicted GNAT superfamily acetyltransferase
MTRIDSRSQDLQELYERRLALRRVALDNGADVVGWTFDPLDAAEAHLSISRLGAVVERYLADDDRVLAEWWIRKPHVERRIAPAGSFTLRAADVGGAPIVTLTSDAIDTAERRIQVQIPADMSAEPSDIWRAHLRRVFTTCFASGYRIVDFVVDGERGRYLFARPA